jgi:hypothetical protein
MGVVVVGRINKRCALTNLSNLSIALDHNGILKRFRRNVKIYNRISRAFSQKITLLV